MDTWRMAIATRMTRIRNLRRGDQLMTQSDHPNNLSVHQAGCQPPPRPGCWTPSWSAWPIMAPGPVLRDRAIGGFRQPAVPLGRGGRGDPRHR